MLQSALPHLDVKAEKKPKAKSATGSTLSAICGAVLQPHTHFKAFLRHYQHVLWEDTTIFNCVKPNQKEVTSACLYVKYHYSKG